MICRSCPWWALVLAAAVAASSAAAAPSRTDPAALQRRLAAELAAGRVSEAERAATDLVAARARLRKLSPRGAAALLDSLGSTFFRAGTPEAWAAAERLFRGALARRESALGADHVEVASSLVTVATVLDYQGRWSEALPLAERALAIRTRAAPTVVASDSLAVAAAADVAASLRQVGLFRFQLGEYAGAREPLARSAEIYASLGAAREPRLADALNNLGELARVEDRFAEAEAHFRRGLEIARRRLGEDDPLHITLTNNLAGLAKDLGRYDDAEPLLERAVAMSERAGEGPEALATLLLNLAEVRRLQGRGAESAPLYARALEQARRALVADHPALVPFLNQAAVSAQDQGRFASAESLFAETRSIVERGLGPSHPLLAQNLNDLAGLRLAAGEVAAPDSAYAAALALRERGLGASHPDVAQTLVDLAAARARGAGGLDAAEPLATRALAILEASPAYPEAGLEAHALRARWHAAHGRRTAALAEVTAALDAVDTLRTHRGGGDDTRARFIARRLELFDRAIEWRLEAGEVERALETHERSRARVLLDQIAAGGVDLRAGIAPEVLAPLEQAQRAAETMLAASQRRIQETRANPELGARERLEAEAALTVTRDSAATALTRARERIKDASPLWRQVLGGEGGAATAAELRRDVAPSRGMLLVYHVGETKSVVFAVPVRGRPTAFPLVVDPEAARTLSIAPGPLTASTLERIVTGARGPAWPDSGPAVAELLAGSREGGYAVLRHRSRSGPDSLELRLHTLWRVLVPPRLWPRVRSADVAVVVPDGALHLVPFEALVVTPRGRAAATRFWLDDGPALAYGVSATSLRNLARRPRPDEPRPAADVLSVSDVDFAMPRRDDAPAAAIPSRRLWSPLPGTARETEQIRTAFGSSRVMSVSGRAASEPAVRAALPGRRYVHLATHGFVDEAGSHLLAGLVLASPASSPAGDDGVLQLYEIYGTKLSCDLAVLSACETQRGPLVAGEGAFALSRGFLAAGARRVVASLWAVRDEPTAELVGALFGSVAAAEGDALRMRDAIALRDAKRRVRADPRWADPFYWAPFVLSGL